MQFRVSSAAAHVGPMTRLQHMEHKLTNNHTSVTCSFTSEKKETRCMEEQ